MAPPCTVATIVWTPEDATALEKTLESLVLGPCRPDEILVMAAALTDVTAELVAAFARRHPGLHPPQRDEGSRRLESFDGAVPLAIEAARADWVLVLAAGDVVLPDAFRRAVALANEHPTAGAVLARAVTCDPAGAPASPPRGVPGRTSACFEPPARFRELSLAGGGDPLDHAVPGAALLRREALVALGCVRPDLGPLGLSVAAWALAAIHGAVCLPEPLVDEQGPLRGLERASVEDPGLLLEPMKHLKELELSIPREDVRKLEEHLRERVTASARATFTRACDTLGAAARILEAGGRAPLRDRALARVIDLMVRLERGLQSSPRGDTNA